jgi:hypothetical protein
MDIPKQEPSVQTIVPPFKTRNAIEDYYLKRVNKLDNKFPKKKKYIIPREYTSFWISACHPIQADDPTAFSKDFDITKLEEAIFWSISITTKSIQFTDENLLFDSAFWRESGILFGSTGSVQAPIFFYRVGDVTFLYARKPNGAFAIWKLNYQHFPGVLPYLDVYKKAIQTYISYKKIVDFPDSLSYVPLPFFKDWSPSLQKFTYFREGAANVKPILTELERTHFSDKKKGVNFIWIPFFATNRQNGEPKPGEIVLTGRSAAAEKAVEVARRIDYPFFESMTRKRKVETTFLESFGIRPSADPPFLKSIGAPEVSIKETFLESMNPRQKRQRTEKEMSFLKSLKK